MLGRILQEEEGQDREEGDVQFIDFEYSDTTYRAFDMANHFCEYAGFECDYSRFPDQSHVEYFVREYLKADAKVVSTFWLVFSIPDRA